NRAGEMEQKRQFYAQYGVEEYYEYDPDRGTLRGWQREHDALVPIQQMLGWISPRLKVHFDLDEEDLVLTGPDGHRLESYLEIAEAREQAEARAREAEAQSEREREAREQAEAEMERLRALLRERGLLNE